MPLREARAHACYKISCPNLFSPNHIMSSTGNIEKVQINKDSYPELFLDEYDIRLFNDSPPSSQQSFLDDWKVYNLVWLTSKVLIALHSWEEPF